MKTMYFKFINLISIFKFEYNSEHLELWRNRPYDLTLVRVREEEEEEKTHNVLKVYLKVYRKKSSHPFFSKHTSVMKILCASQWFENCITRWPLVQLLRSLTLKRKKWHSLGLAVLKLLLIIYSANTGKYAKFKIRSLKWWNSTVNYFIRNVVGIATG
jgi:hypothetical protein